MKYHKQFLKLINISLQQKVFDFYFEWNTIYSTMLFLTYTFYLRYI